MPNVSGESGFRHEQVTHDADSRVDLEREAVEYYSEEQRAQGRANLLTEKEPDPDAKA